MVRTTRWVHLTKAGLAISTGHVACAEVQVHVCCAIRLAARRLPRCVLPIHNHVCPTSCHAPPPPFPPEHNTSSKPKINLPLSSNIRSPLTSPLAYTQSLDGKITAAVGGAEQALTAAASTLSDKV